VHAQTFLAFILVLFAIGAQFAVRRSTAATPQAVEPETVRHMRERVESLAAQLRNGEITRQDWQAQMGAFRADRATSS
jgi:hypothetical protein